MLLMGAWGTGLGIASGKAPFGVASLVSTVTVLVCGKSGKTVERDERYGLREPNGSSPRALCG